MLYHPPYKESSRGWGSERWEGQRKALEHAAAAAAALPFPPHPRAIESEDSPTLGRERESGLDEA